MLKMDRDKLISAVYSAAMSPDGYDETLETIDKLVFNQQHHELEESFVHEPKKIDQYIIDPDLLAHFERALDIQNRMGRQKTEKPKVQMLLDVAPNPAFVIDAKENIVAMNSLAKNISQSKCRKLADCCDNRHVLESIRKFIKNGDGQKLLVDTGYINVRQNTNTCILVRKMEKNIDFGLPTQKNTQPAKLYFFTIVDLGFDNSKTDLFQKTYDLTKAEVDIAVQLASGKQLPEIATERGVTVATIRTQFKSVKKKTGSRDIPSVVRLLCGFSAGILISSQLSQSPTMDNNNGTGLKSKNQITLRDGRKLAYLEQGSPDGFPVIMLHTMPYGQELLEDANKAANRMNLRIIAPFRPGYGETDMPKNIHYDKLLDVAAADIYELLDYLGISKAVLVGMSIASVYAMRFATLYPNRVSGLFAVSRAPIWRDAWMDSMPKRQRLIMRLAKYMPQLLPLVLRATVAYIDKGRAQDLFRNVCADSAADMQALKNPDICELMEKSFAAGLRQGGNAVIQDSFIAITDFSAEASHLKHRFHILHGDDDKVVDIAQSKVFAEMIPGTELEIVKGAGQLLIYSHWEHVLRAIKKKHT